jgi:hypothetical protein
MNLENKPVEVLGSSKNREIQKARILSCYSNASAPIKKAEETKPLEKAESTGPINQSGTGNKTLPWVSKILADIDISVKQVLATGRKLGIKK